MKLLKEQKIRILYTLISIIAIFYAYKLKGLALSDTNTFNFFSYIGVIATLIALLITVFEVIHSINISKGIRDHAKELLKESQSVNGASFVSECLAELDEANTHISFEKYSLSLKCFQNFRKTYLRISGPSDVIERINEIIREVELSLQRATYTTPTSPLTKKKRMELQEKILEIKTLVEKINPAKRGSYVSA